MQTYSLSHLADDVLVRDLTALAARDRATTAALLAHMAEVDERRLFVPLSYPSMFAYCVGELRMSEDAAAKRIQAARVARQFPAIFPALADGRLHLSSVVLLAPHLSPGNADELLAGAAHRTRAALEKLLAERFPRPGAPAFLPALDPAAGAAPQGEGPADGLAAEPEPAGVCENGEQHAPGHVRAQSTGSVSTGPVGPPRSRARLTPIGPGTYELQAILGQAMADQLTRALELLSHSIAPGDLGAVLDRAVVLLVVQLEKRRCAATDRPRRAQGRRSANPRHVPAEVVRAVWARDGGQCTFVGENGRRCEARHRLELDHLDPVGRGGIATVERMRLLCTVHNQFVAEREYGAEFMRGRREAAKRRAIEARMRKEAESAREAEAAETARQQEEIVPWLRALGFKTAEARAAAARCVAVANAPIEERIKYALKSLAPASARRIAPVTRAEPPASNAA